MGFARLLVKMGWLSLTSSSMTKVKFLKFSISNINYKIVNQIE